MEIPFGNFVWKFRLEISFVNFVWNSCLEILFGNFVWEFRLENLFGGQTDRLLEAPSRSLKSHMNLGMYFRVFLRKGNLTKTYF